MLQLIGFWLGLYLAMKGFELLERRSKMATIGAVISFLSGPLFFLLFLA